MTNNMFCFVEVSHLRHSNYYFCLYTIQVVNVGGIALNRGSDIAHANFMAHQSSLLNITNIGLDYVLKDSECGLACVSMPSCFSFNLAAFPNVMSEKLLCELLLSDIYNNSKEFVASQFHHHYRIRVSENSALKN